MVKVKEVKCATEPRRETGPKTLKEMSASDRRARRESAWNRIRYDGGNCGVAAVGDGVCT
jgi:hypothetical protein